MSNLHLIFFDGDRQIDSWVINPTWDALDVAEFLNSLGADIYDYIRDLEVPDENPEDEDDRPRIPPPRRGVAGGPST
jgi:hypothetical protein